MNLSIKGKFTAASFTLIALVSGLVLFLLGVQKNLENQLNEMIQKNLSAIRKAEQIKYHVVLYDDLIFRYLVTDDKGFLTEAVSALEETQEWINQMKGLVDGETEKEILDEIERETLRYRDGVRKLIGVYQKNKSQAEVSRKEEKRGLLKFFSAPAPKSRPTRIGKEKISQASAAGKSRLVRIYSQCEKMVDIFRSKMEAAQQEMKRKIRTARAAVYTMGSIAFIAALAVVILLALEILAPIQRLLAGVQKVSAGELNLELPISSSDEIGRLTQHFNSMTRSLKEKQERLLTETITDPLTGLHNLRYFQTQLQSEVLRAQRHHHSFCLMIIDIDHFKNFNDKNGHQMGNMILKAVAELIKNSVRGDGVTARYGGEEFALILPETDAKGGKAVAERIRALIEKSVFPGQDKQPHGALTVSIGGANYPENGIASSELFEKADRALYKAKATGRNRVHWAEGWKNRTSYVS